MSSDFNNTNKSENLECPNDGSRPNDLSDGIAITSIIMLCVTGIIYYLYTM